MIEPAHPKLSVTEQCALLELPRSSYYHQPLPESDDNHRLMRKRRPGCLLDVDRSYESDDVMVTNLT